MEKELKPDRYEHTIGVAYTAASLAMAHGADVEKALIAGFLHDCAKYLSHEEQIKICEKNNIEVTDVEKRNHSWQRKYLLYGDILEKLLPMLKSFRWIL